MKQVKYFKQDIKRMLGKHKIRILQIWLSRTFLGIFLYRFERSLFLLIGNPYRIIRLPFIPIYYLLQSYSNIDIHYKAEIKGGLLILHASVGCVISGQCIIGENLTLAGGNVIGTKKKCKKGSFQIGNDCTLGANATIIGPLILGNRNRVGASACVVSSFENDDITLIGVPAKKFNECGSV